MGCLPDQGDGRDFNAAKFADDLSIVKTIWNELSVADQQEALPMIQAGLQVPGSDMLSPGSTLPAKLNLASNGYFGTAANQGPWNTCTAYAVTALMEYHNRAKERFPSDLSRTFLYNATRRLMRVRGDLGASLRVAMKAATEIGIAPLGEWPDDARGLMAAPDALTCQIASHQRLKKYYRLDDGTVNGDDLVLRIKQALQFKHPVTCGIPVHASISECGEDNCYFIPFPRTSRSVDDPVLGGHALLIIGFNDNAVEPPPPWESTGAETASVTDKGAFIVLNSWGPDWGDYGYAFLPYRFVKHGLALDLWVGMIEEHLKPEATPTKAAKTVTKAEGAKRKKPEN